MPPISRPPPTCRRLAVTSAQPAPTPPSDHRLHPVLSVLWVLFMDSFAISTFLFILLGVVLSFEIWIDPTSLASEATQPASPPLSDDTMGMHYGPVGTPIAFAFFSASFIMIFLLFLNAILSIIIYGPVPPEYRRVAPFHPPHDRPPLRAPRGLDPAIIKTFPIVLYTAVKGQKNSEVPLECAVCLNRFKDDNKLQLIPKCDHAFHPNCISKWFASHTTCPVCRTNLASQLVVHSASQLPKASTEPPRVEVKVEASTPDGVAPERIPQEDGQEKIQPPDLWDKIESGSFHDRNRTHGSGGIGGFPRSDSTGHSLTQPGEDAERFTLRLPILVRKQMIDQPGPVLPLEGCSRQGYLGGGEASSPGSYYFTSPARLDQAAKPERLDFKRISSTVAADGGEGSSRGSVLQARPAI